MTVYLALRKTDNPSFFGGWFNRLTRWRLHTDYPHSGIVIGGDLYHTTYKDGLHREDFNAQGWELFATDSDAGYVRAAFNARKGAAYDAFSLLAFILPWRVRDSRRLYCYEWSWLALTASNPSDRVTPEKLLAYIAK